MSGRDYQRDGLIWCDPLFLCTVFQERSHGCVWRIRLAAYVARLERVLGAIPQGFKSPILRHLSPRD